MDKKNPDEVETYIFDRLDRWPCLVQILRLVHVSLGLVATVSSLLVAATLDTLDEGILQWAALAAAVAVGIMSGFDLGSKSNAYRRAWRQLQVAKLRYQASPDFTLNDLITAYKEAEDLIGDVKEQPQ